MPRTYVDNASNRALGRVGMPHGSMVVSRSSGGGGSSTSYGGSSYGGCSSYGRSSSSSYSPSYGYGGASSSSSSSSKTYVDNALNRSLGRVGMEHGTAVHSRSSANSSISSGSSKTYVDNSLNRSLGRVGMEHGTAVHSRSSVSNTSSSGRSTSNSSIGSYANCQGTSSGYSKHYVNNELNRRLGRVGLEHGSAVYSKTSSTPNASGNSSSRLTSTPKTYADNPFNRSLGRVGLEHGTAVHSRSSASAAMASPIPSTKPVYVDSPLNRSLGRVGKPRGSVPFSPANVKTYVDNAMNRKLGRVGKPLGSMPVSRKSKTTTDAWKLFQEMQQGNNPFIPDDSGYCGSPQKEIECPYDENAYNLVQNLMNRLLEEEAYLRQQRESAERRHREFQDSLKSEETKIQSKRPTTAKDFIKTYGGSCISFEDIKLGDKIGSGGFGDVHFAMINNAIVAVKKLRVQRVSKKRLQEFTSEVGIFCQLDHPNIVKFIGACTVTPNLCIVMEYMHISLYEALHISTEYDFSDEDRLWLVRDISNGLSYLHSKDMAHCDFKSQNVLLKKDDIGQVVAKITDFGLSMLRNESETTSTRTVKNVGTPRYCAPEVLRGEELSAKQMMMADVYSYSLVLFEIIYEAEPFDKYNIHQLRKQVGELGKLPEVPHDAVDINPSVFNILDACWRRNNNERPKSEYLAKYFNQLSSIYA